MTPLPPGLLSMMTLVPRFLAIAPATERNTRSVIVPGANGTTMVIGLDG